MQIHVARGGQQLGEFPAEEVRRRLASGEFQPGDMGWAEGRTEWTTLSSIPGLLMPPAAGQKLPPPIPPGVATLAPSASNGGISTSSGERVPTAGTAIASLVFGILNFSLLPILSSIPAIICGHIAYSRIKHASGRLKGNGLATAGLILGYLGLAMLPFFIGMAIPIFKAVQDKGLQIKSLNQGKMIATACRLYAVDHAGAFPRELKELIPDYLDGPEALICPILGHSEPVGYEYYGGKDTDPPKNILLVGKSVSRRKERVVIYADCSGKVVKNMPLLPPQKTLLP